MIWGIIWALLCLMCLHACQAYYLAGANKESGWAVFCLMVELIFIGCLVAVAVHNPELR